MRLISPLVNRLCLRREGAPGPARRILLYCPNLGGHRPLYSKNLADALLSFNPDHVVFAYCGIQVDGKRKFAPLQSPHLEAMAAAGIEMLDITARLGPDDDELRLISELQREHNIDYTLFVDGDALIPEFTRQIRPNSPKLRGRNYAIFILSEFFHIPRFRLRDWKSAERRLMMKQKNFHLRLMRSLDLLEGGLYSDECLVRAAKSEKFLHIPEVGHARIEQNGDEGRARFFSEVEQRYLEFLRQHSGRDVILSFGDLEPRKGFDFLLRLVKENDDLVLARLGRIKPSYSPTWQSVLDKEQLIYEGRLFELDHYINSQRLIDTLFQSIRYLLLPYKSFYRTSSVMIQALSYGKPVLVPHIGLLRQRVEKRNLGRYFRHLDYPSFVTEFQELRRRLDSYAASIQSYYGGEFSQDAVARTLARTVK